MRNEVSSSKRDSFVVDLGRQLSSCEYCRSSGRTRISHGLLAESLTVDDYQELVDRGWRRSGCILYKPEMERTCCPSYTIRLKASDFVPSKKQLRVSRRMQRFLDGTLDVKKAELLEDPNSSKESESSVHNVLSNTTSEEYLSASKEGQNEVGKALNFLSNQIDKVVYLFIEKGEFHSGIQLPKASIRIVSQGIRKLLVNGSEDLLYSSNIAFQIAASLRRAQLVITHKDVHQPKPSGDCAEENGACSKIIAEKLAASLAPEVKNYGLSIRACSGHINFYSSSKQVLLGGSVQNFGVPKKYGMKLGSGRNCLSSPQPSQVPRRRIKICLKRSSFDPEEFALYRRYQLKVHNDKPEHVTETLYCSFLVDTPLFYVPPTGDETVPPCGFGSFHQQFVIDGQLVAVGVIDILPKCLSSKYFFWDPDFAFLSLGKYSVLKEIGWVKENQVYCPSLQYYYLGYYIHSCDKMKYKAAYRPSELLCPLRYQWVPYDIAKPLLDRKPYVVLSDASIIQNGESPQVIEDVMETQLHDIGQEDANGVLLDEDEGMVDSDQESSDDKPDRATTSYGETDNDGISNILLGFEATRLRYKDLRSSIGPKKRNYLESQLQKYMEVVGPELSERMVYSP